MQDKKGAWVWVGVVVVVIGVVLFFIWKPSAKEPVAVQTNPSPVYAAQGQLTPQFPQELILDGMNNVTSSYSIAYSSTTNQYTAVFNASTSMTDLFNLYTQYFLNNKWTIKNSMTKDSNIRGLYVTNASSDVAVAIVSQGTDSRVTISLETK